MIIIPISFPPGHVLCPGFFYSFRFPADTKKGHHSDLIYYLASAGNFNDPANEDTDDKREYSEAQTDPPADNQLTAGFSGVTDGETSPVPGRRKSVIPPPLTAAHSRTDNSFIRISLSIKKLYSDIPVYR